MTAAASLAGTLPPYIGSRGFRAFRVLHINERCAIAWMVIYIFPACKIGKMPARGNLFDQMKEAPEPGR